MSSRSDTVREKLEQMIVEGVFHNGERLDEVKLSQRFDVSRTPLREAFQALAASGLLSLEPRRGAFVRHPAFEELIEMFEVMAEMEAFCGRLASRRMTPVLITRLSETVATCEQAVADDDIDIYYRANETFHHLVYEASGNAFLAGEAARLHRRLKPFRRLQLKVRGRMAQSLAEHRRILDALIDGDAEIASETLRSHVAVQGGKFNDLIVNYRRATQRTEPEVPR
ncbi:GntR family transcriptional regulator [Aquamicrobium sp. LC103]|uniref:GntR family transcriptional regulator n=1 Tax=Aquamicrobium sp. LC103 TaxID=1120658 RepID=UPI00063E8D87|nr:GntR family transcriptional regulator [Aquamicrobium sp. LC103]TKT74373.1 GntR family transcriptional regulator [Aquamicrobium sp. LC103]